MKKIGLLFALTATALPLTAQYDGSSFYEDETLAERNARTIQAAQRAADAQQSNGGDIYRGKVFNATQESYANRTLGNRTPVKTKYVYDTSLIRAIKMGDEDRVRTLIYANIDVNERNYANLTPLTVAAEKGNMTILKYLVEAGANVNAASPFGVTPVIAGAAANQRDAVQYLLANGAKADVKDDTGKTPILYASHFNDADLMKSLVKATPEAVNISDGVGNTPLIYSSQKGFINNVKVLVANKAQVNYRNPATGVSATAAAAAEGHADVIRILAKQGKADLDLADNEGRTPLAYAAENSQQAAMRELLSLGANPNTQDKNGVSPLMRAAAKGDDYSVSLLLRQKNILPDLQDAQGRTALMYSASAPDNKTATLLVRKGVNLNVTDNLGNTALTTALSAQNEAVANLLISQGADARRNATVATQQYIPDSMAAQTLTNKKDAAYQTALQEEAARLAQVRELEDQLAQDEARVQALRTAQEQAASNAQALRDQVAQEKIAELRDVLGEPIEEVQLMETTVQEKAVQQTAAVKQQASQVKQMATQSTATTQKTGRQNAKKRGTKQTTATRGTIQPATTLQPRLRSMADPL